MSEFKAKIIAELDTSKLEAQLRNLNNKQYKINLSSGNAQQNINDINKSISNTTKTTKSFGDTLKNSFKIGSTASIVYRSFDLITDAANGALNAVKDIDNAIKDLRMATGYTYEETSKLVSEYNQMAQALGATTTEMTKGADAWLRQGHSVADTNTLITDSMILSKVANLDSADATEYLTSAMKGYGVAVNDVIGIVDKLTSVDLVSATSADGLAEAMSRTAVSANLAGVSMDKLLGYLAATGEVTQESMSVIGNAFKTFFARYSAIKTGKLELIDEDGTTEVLSDVEQSLKNVGINIRSTITDFDNAGDALDDLSSKWNTLNGVQKSAIASAFGGTRQKNRFLVLMENYQKAQSYMQTAENSTGTAEKKFSAYLDTIEAKTKSLQASFEALATDTVSTDMLKGIIDASAAVVEFVDNTNLLKGSLTGVVTAGVIAGFNKLAKGISSAAVNMSDFGNAMTLLKNGEVGLDDFNDLILMTQNLSDSQLKAVLSSQALTNEQRIAILTAQGLSASEAQTALSSMGLASAEGAATASTFSLSAALKGLWATCKAHPLLLIAAGVTAATMAFSALSEAAENAAQAAAEQAQKSKEAADKAKEESNTLSELIAKYKELKQSDKWDASTREEIKNIQTEITKIVGVQADNLDLVNGKLDDEIDKLNTLKNIIQGDNLSTYEKAYTDAQKAVTDKKYSKNWINALFGSSDSLYIDADALGTKIIGDTWTAQGYNAKATYMAGGESVFNLPQDISEKTAALDVAIRALEDYNGYDFANSGLWNKLGEIKEDLFGSDGLITNQVDAANDLLEQLADKNVNEDVNLSTFDDYLAYRQEVIDKVLGNKVIKKAIEDGALNNDSITAYIDSYLGTLDKFSEYYEKFNINNNMSDLKTMFYNWNFEDALPEVSEFNKWIDSLKDDKKEIIYDIYCNTDTATWNLERWQNALDNYNANDYREVIATTFTDLMAEEDTDSESSFTTKVDDYIESVNKLQEALDNYRKGELKNEDLTELIKLFPELAGETDNLDEALVNLIDTLTYGTNGKGGINAEFDFQFKRMETEKDTKALENFRQTVLKTSDTIKNTQFSIEITTEIGDMDNLYSAMKESVTSTGLSDESIANLKDRYKDLENFAPDELFEKTENGIHLNTKALRELESAYEKQTKTNIDKHLSTLKDKYADLTTQIDLCTDASERADLYKDRQNILNQIEDTSTLAAQYEGLTSAFYKWEQSQSIGEEGDMYDSLAGGLEHIKELYEEGLIGTNEFRSAVQLMSNDDLSNASVDKLLAVYENSFGKMSEYFTEGSDGCLNFLNDVSKLNSEWVKLNSDGSWNINFGVGNDEEIAEKLGLNVDTIQSIIRKLSDYGFDVKLDSEYTQIEVASSKLDEANQKLQTMGKTKVTFDFATDDIDDVETQIKEAQKVLDTFKDNDGTINLKADGVEEIQLIFSTLLAQKQELEAPAIMSIDTSQLSSGSTESRVVKDTIGYLQDYQNALNQYEIDTKIGIDTTESQKAIQESVAKLNEIPNSIKAKLGLDDESFIKAADRISETKVNFNSGVNLDSGSLETIKKTIAEINPDMLVKAGLDADVVENYTPPTKTVTYESDFSKIADPPTLEGKVIYNAEFPFVPTGTNNTKTNDISKLKNSAKTIPSFPGFSYAQGNADNALVGELKPELLVRDGKYHLLGKDSAELYEHKKGDIIFNGEQTEQLLRSGKITQGNKRGKAYVQGNAYSSGIGKITASGQVITTASNSSNSSDSTSADEFLETFDWIETLVDRIERAIKRLDTTAKSIYKNWTTRNNKLNEELSKTYEEINVQREAYYRYIEQAHAVGVPTDWLYAIENGLIDISQIQDENLADMVKEYQQWYEKALACKDAIDELTESVSELYKTSFDNIVTQFDGIVGQIDTSTSLIQESLAQFESKGYLNSSAYYRKLISNEEKSISQLEQERSQLTKSLYTAIYDGAITKGSEAWYEMTDQINEVSLAIEEANTAIIEYQNKMRELEWNAFDLVQDRISQVNDEANFLKSLIDEDDFYNDRGQFTNDGKTATGLYALKYNIDMAQAKMYADEIEELQKQINKDPYNQDLINRREELIKLQQDSISAAEDEKDAIVDMVKNGIDLELDSLKELIDKYNDALDSQKDLYDFQKKVKNQTQDIATLQKQLAVYENDISEESRAKVQELKTSLQKAQDDLEETQYDRYVSDQKDILDEIYSEYENVLNKRLDNVDVLISDMIDTTNDNVGLICDVISDKAASVGYQISDSMASIWHTNTNNISSVVSLCGGDITKSITSTNDVLKSIDKKVDTMMNGTYRYGANSAANATSSQVQNSSTLSRVQGYSDGGFMAEVQRIAAEQGDDIVTVNTLKKGEAVLTPEQAAQFKKLVQEIPQITYLTQSNMSDRLANIQESPVVNQTVNNEVNVNIPIERVMDYKDFVNQLRDDRKFEKMIQSMTIDRALGKSEFAKRKYRW